MSSDQGHGVAVETDSLLSALVPTRTLQHALEVLWDNLPPDLETDALRAAFYELDDRLRKAALENIRRGVLARDYFILSPHQPDQPAQPRGHGKGNRRVPHPRRPRTDHHPVDPVRCRREALTQ